MNDITEGQRRWLEKLHDQFGNPFEDLHYGIGHEGCARMVVGGFVFVVDRETNRVHVEQAGDLTVPMNVKDLMIWREDNGLDGSYEATRESLT